MKRFIICLILLFAVSAHAEVQEFRYFSLYIPENWTANEDGPVVSVIADDKSGSLSITSSQTEENSLDDIAKGFAAELGGTVPEADDEGIYTFDFNDGASHAILTGTEDFYMLIVLSANNEESEEILAEIFESLEIK